MRLMESPPIVVILFCKSAHRYGSEAVLPVYYRRPRHRPEHGFHPGLLSNSTPNPVERSHSGNFSAEHQFYFGRTGLEGFVANLAGMDRDLKGKAELRTRHVVRVWRSLSAPIRPA